MQRTERGELLGTLLVRVMMSKMLKRGFRSLVVSQGSTKGEVLHEVVHSNSLQDLPFQPQTSSTPCTVVNISWSTINYKDGLVLQGKPGVAKQFPLVPGIDCAGVVESCSTSRFQPGEKVVLTGNYLGQHMDGCYSEKVNVPTDWLVPLPKDLTERQSMIIGTAGFTAMQSVMSLEAYGQLGKNASILVTGSSGGVGSTAVSILGKLGFTNVTASTGRVEENEAWLKRLGAAQVMGRVEATGRALGKEKWDACVDTVGGDTLSTVLAETKYGGVVTCCGLAQSPSLKTLTVMPFILRGVKLIGIDSVQLPMKERQEVSEMKSFTVVNVEVRAHV